MSRRTRLLIGLVVALLAPASSGAEPEQEVEVVVIRGTHARVEKPLSDLGRGESVERGVHVIRPEGVRAPERRREPEEQATTTVVVLPGVEQRETWETIGVPPSPWRWRHERWRYARRARGGAHFHPAHHPLGIHRGPVGRGRHASRGHGAVARAGARAHGHGGRR
jgi:hypothetical protein